MKAIFTALISLIILIAAPHANALETPWITSGDIQGKMILSSVQIEESGKLYGAIQLRHGAGWHSYWRSPGESGLAPVFDWRKTPNIKDVKISYPLPKRYDEMGLTTFGYSEDVVFLFEAQFEQATKPESLNLQLNTMICNDICIPVSLSMNIDSLQNPEELEKSRNNALIDFARTKIPSPHNTSGLKIENVVLTKEALVINAYSNRGFAQADLFTEIEGYAIPSMPEIIIDKDNSNIAMMRVSMPADVQSDMIGVGGTPYADKKIILTLTNGRESIERSDLF